MIFFIMQAVCLFARQQFIYSVILTAVPPHLSIFPSTLDGSFSLARSWLHSRHTIQKSEDCAKVDDSQNDGLPR